MKQFDVMVAGAGIWGCTLARRLAESGRKVLLIERRAGIGGNCRAEIDAETGIEIHSYGSHIFHTHNREVWDFVRRFTEFNGYQHKVLARYRGETYQLPLGLALINRFFKVELTPGEVEGFLDDGRRRAIFDAFFRGYTSKQWGRPPEEIDPSVIKRVPVRANYDVNYFNDYWQGIPAEGYNRMFERLVEHPNIELRCNTEFALGTESQIAGAERLAKICYSGPMDALFGYRFGALPWRSLRFELERLEIADFQGTTVMNYTEAEVPYTRIHEFRHYHPEPTWPRPAAADCKPQTIIMREYSKAWQPGDEPYYPVNSEASAALLRRYQEELAKYNLEAQRTGRPEVTVGGRLGQYRYYDMDQAMAAALEVEI